MIWPKFWCNSYPAEVIQFQKIELDFQKQIKELTFSTLKVSRVCKMYLFLCQNVKVEFLLLVLSKTKSLDFRREKINVTNRLVKNLILLSSLSLISILIFIWIWYALKPIECMSVLRPGVVRFKLIIDSRPGSSIGLFGSSVYLRTRTSTEGLQLGLTIAPWLYYQSGLISATSSTKAVFLNSLSYSTTIASFYKGKLTLEVPCYCRILYVMALQC